MRRKQTTLIVTSTMIFLLLTMSQLPATQSVQNIHPDPEKRLTPKETREKFDKYLYVKELNNTENFLEILDNITEFRREMNDQIKENIKEVKRLGTILDVDDI